jgi:hypothetical protein
MSELVLYIIIKLLLSCLYIVFIYSSKHFYYMFGPYSENNINI